jgi:hypothetical protein
MGQSDITKEENTITNRRMKRNGWERFQSMTIVILVIIILLMQQCNGSGISIFGRKSNPIEPKIVTEIVTVWDTLEIEKEVYVPKWRTKVVKEYDTIEVKVPQDVDTLSILRDYYTEYQYIDTIFVDSLGFIVLTDTISRNMILNRDPNFNIQIPTKIVNNNIYINEREFYAGMGARTNGNNISWMGLEGVYRSRRGNTFTIGIGTDNENKFSAGAGVHWRIGGN